MNTIPEQISQASATKNYSWVSSFIGKPWEILARGPDSYDCYGLVWDVVRKIYGIELPQFLEVDATSNLSVARAFVKHSMSYTHHTEKVPGCVVLCGRAGISHCGIYLADTDSLLHVVEGQTSCVESLSKCRHRGLHNWRYYSPIKK